jgi:hypothetical protein
MGWKIDTVVGVGSVKDGVARLQVTCPAVAQADWGDRMQDVFWSCAVLSCSHSCSQLRPGSTAFRFPHSSSTSQPHTVKAAMFARNLLENATSPILLVCCDLPVDRKHDGRNL